MPAVVQGLQAMQLELTPCAARAELPDGRGHCEKASSRPRSCGAASRSGQMAYERRNIVECDCDSRQCRLARVACHHPGGSCSDLRSDHTAECQGKIVHRVLEEQPSGGSATPCIKVSRPVEERKPGWPESPRTSHMIVEAG